MRTEKMKTKITVVKILPVALPEGVEAKLISNLSSIHCIWKILLVSKYKQHSISQFILLMQQKKHYNQDTEPPCQIPVKNENSTKTNILQL